jgi:hypothetical protein
MVSALNGNHRAHAYARSSHVGQWSCRKHPRRFVVAPKLANALAMGPDRGTWMLGGGV